MDHSSLTPFYSIDPNRQVNENNEILTLNHQTDSIDDKVQGISKKSLKEVPSLASKLKPSSFTHLAHHKNITKLFQLVLKGGTNKLPTHEFNLSKLQNDLIIQNNCENIQGFIALVKKRQKLNDLTESLQDQLDLDKLNQAEEIKDFLNLLQKLWPEISRNSGENLKKIVSEDLFEDIDYFNNLYKDLCDLIQQQYQEANDLLTIQNVQDAASFIPTWQFSKDPLEKMAVSLFDEEILEKMVAKADELAHISMFITDPNILTTSQLLYHHAAAGYLSCNQLEKGFELLVKAAQQETFSPVVLSKVEEAVKTFSIDNISTQSSFTGVSVSQIGTWGIKDQCVRILPKNYENNQFISFEIKLNKQAYEQTQKWLEAIQQNLSIWQEFLPHTCTIQENDFAFEKQNQGVFSTTETYKFKEVHSVTFDFGDLGQVTINKVQGQDLKDENYRILSDQIEVKIAQTDNPLDLIKKTHMLLSMVGCPPVFVPSREIDLERRKLNQLFSAFYPDNARQFNATMGYFNLPIDVVKDLMIRTNPSMKGLIEEYIDNKQLKLIETIPGKEVFSLNMDERMRKAKAVGLFLGVTGPKPENRLANIIKRGLMSTHLRYSSGHFIEGSSLKNDYMKGGAESVFTRIVTERHLQLEIGKFTMSGDVQILIDLEALNPITSYAHADDAFGSRQRNRVNLEQFTKNIETASQNSHYISNEIMVRDNISPQFIKKIVVKNQDIKNRIIEKIKEDNLIIVRNNIQYIQVANNKLIPLDDFIVVDGFFKKEMWK